MGELSAYRRDNDQLSAIESFVLARGNIRRLKEYWARGAGAARIRWGTEGDLSRCHREVSQEVSAEDMTSDDIWGFCNNLHKELFGRPNDPND